MDATIRLLPSFNEDIADGKEGIFCYGNRSIFIDLRRNNAARTSRLFTTTFSDGK